MEQRFIVNGINNDKIELVSNYDVRKLNRLLDATERMWLTKIKQAKEDIQEKAFIDEIFDEDIFNSTYTDSTLKETAECESYVETEVVKMSDVLEILDRLIAESEG